jgi:hypothetical protein
MTTGPTLFSGYETHGCSGGGDNVSGCPHPENGYAVSTLVGAFPWYWTVTDDGKLLQDSNVFRLCHQASMPWVWNDAAISQIALVGHTLGTHTLHARIFRMPPDCRVSLDRGKARIERFNTFSTFKWGHEDLDEHLCGLPATFADCVDSSLEPILSLSGGYDSRVLLALCERLGCNPSIVTMGSSLATDVKIAKLLAAQLGREVNQIEVRPEDYVAFGEEISQTTSGVKTAADWHTWLYNKQVNDPARTHLVGSNGEFVRTFFTDAITKRGLFRRSGRVGAKAWLLLKALNRFRKYPKALRATGRLKVAKLLDDLRVSPEAYPSDALDCLDVFYASERVHHFIGSGLACYAQFTRPKSPFLDRRWVESAAALKRSWKEESRYHSTAVDRLCPELSRFPYNRDPDGGVSVSYSPFDSVAKSRDVEELIVESAFLDHVCARHVRVESLREPNHRRNTVSFLLTMHFAGVNAATCSCR